MACSLGCSSTGCQITDIAQNEIITWTFNKAVDPASVNDATIQFRTVSGDVPIGDYLVSDTVVQFVPRVIVISGQSFFGFRAGETYSMHMGGGAGDPNVLRSTSGTTMPSSLNCTLNVTRGVVDHNGAPPTAHVVTPTAFIVPRDVTIVIEFDELLDVTPFFNSTGTSAPIVYSGRRTRVNTAGNRECSPNSSPQPLGGLPQVALDSTRGVTIVSYQPSSPLPGNTCVEVNITDRVRDLAGVPASPQLFQFITEGTELTEHDITEEFITDTNLDRDASSGTWANGLATFGQIGGDGSLGPFQISLGAVDPTPGPDSRLVCTFNTDSTVIPRENTVSGFPFAVTDGNYVFDQMVVPANIRLKFIGNSPPRFTVRGKIEIDGVIDIRGTDQPTYFPNIAFPGVGQLAPGQDGSPGGIFAGRGGKGGDETNGTTPPPTMSGLDGQDCRVLGGHAFAAQVVGTGGRGSRAFPLSGLNSDLAFFPPGSPTSTTIIYGAQAAAGGGGGGLFLPGGVGRVISNDIPEDNPLLGPVGVAPRRSLMGPNARLPVNSSAWATIQRKVQNAATSPTATAIVLGPNGPSEVWVSNLTGTWSNGDPVFTGDGLTQLTTANGAAITNAGKAFPLLPEPATTSSSLHFVVGGSGGGGGGCEPTFLLRVSTAPNSPIAAWAAGAGGSGGGGAIALRAGDTLRIVNGGSVAARGGNIAPGPTSSANDSQATPGGGGSGGSVLLQAGRIADLGVSTGAVDVQGGIGGLINRRSSGSPPFLVNSEGGRGSQGFARLEAPGNLPPSALPVLPGPATSDNVTALQEVDTRTGFRSNFYSTGQPFGPEFVRYEVRALVDGVPVVFSDDPTVGVPARFGQAPIEISLQAGSVDLVTGQVDAGSIKPWRASVVSGGVPGLADDALNGFRFQIILDRTGGQQVQIDSVKVIYRV